MTQYIYPNHHLPMEAITGHSRGTSILTFTNRERGNITDSVVYRIISASLVPLTIAPFAAGSLNPVMDAILCGTIVIHSHIGFQYVPMRHIPNSGLILCRSVIIDYLPKKRMPKIRALFWWGLNAGTLLVAVGLYEFETNDVGVTEAIKKIWTA
jgi:succinate dehydrogenase (ubiquinone) membrane anchor subunit